MISTAYKQNKLKFALTVVVMMSVVAVVCLRSLIVSPPMTKEEQDKIALYTS